MRTYIASPCLGSLISLAAFTTAAAQSPRSVTIYAGGRFGVSFAGRYSSDGGQTAAAGLFSPIGIAVDGFGNVYFADYGMNCLRRMSAGTGVISTIAGTCTSDTYFRDGGSTTEAALGDPSEVVVDRAGNLYIADTYNDVIRRVDANTGVITKVAENGTQGYAGDGGPASSGEQSGPTGASSDTARKINSADQYKNAIRKITIATGLLRQWLARIQQNSGEATDQRSVRSRAVPQILPWLNPAAKPASGESRSARSLSVRPPRWCFMARPSSWWSR